VRTLPERVYFKHGAYYFVSPEKQWIRLGRTEEEALSRYATLASAPEVLNTMNRVFDKYLLEVVPTKAERTQQDNITELKNLRPVFGLMRPQDVKPRHIAEYLVRRTAKIRANREIALLGHIFKKALSWGVVEINPCRGIEKNREYPRDRYVTDKELDRFLAICPPWLKLYVKLKYATGLRKSDMLKLKWGDWDAKIGLSTMISKSGKGSGRRGQLRVLYEPSEDLRGVMNDLRKIHRVSGRRPTTEDSIWKTPRRLGLRQWALMSAWKRVWRKLGVKETDPAYFREHDIRAKSATDADQSGKDATELLMHGDRRTTSTYLRGRRTKRLTPLKNRR
jgi:integrase